MSRTLAFQSLTEDLGFSTEDQLFWWHTTASSLSCLLAQCRYSEEDQFRILRWYHEYIISALGPRPIPGVKQAFEPCLVFDGSACELSVNWKELDPTRTVRFTIEAVGSQAGTLADPFNQDGTIRLLREMAKEDPGIDLTLFEHFVGEFFLPTDVADTLVPKLPADTPLSQVWVAFDLLRDKIIPKVYFIPILKWIHTSTPTKRLVRDAILKHDNKYGSFDHSLAVLDSYLGSFPSEEAPHVEMVAIDCVDSPDSRIKIYLRTAVNTFAKAKDAYTLGGRLSGHVVEATIEVLRDFWSTIFRLDGDDIDTIEVLPRGTGCGYAIEMKAGVSHPEIKIHFPVRKIKGNDGQICESLFNWLQKRGDSEFATQYARYLADAFPKHNLNAENGTHTFVSFAFSQKTGVYMSMYYSTKIFGVHVKKDHWAGYDNVWEVRKEL